MNLANDYFLLYHGIIFEEVDKNKESLFTLNDDSFDIFALFLSITRKDFDKIYGLNIFKNISKQLNFDTPKTFNELNIIQCIIINFLQQTNQKKHISILNSAFTYLVNENFLVKENYKKLSSLFEPNKFIYKVNQTNTFSFLEQKNNLLSINKNLQIIIEDKILLRELSTIKNLLNNQNFSVGITGIMNAGKSTMLNALLGKELLGTSVVPETANLTIIKYGQTQNAKVFYWNTKECI